MFSNPRATRPHLQKRSNAKAFHTEHMPSSSIARRRNHGPTSGESVPPNDARGAGRRARPPLRVGEVLVGKAAYPAAPAKKWKLVGRVSKPASQTPAAAGLRPRPLMLGPATGGQR